MKEVSFKGGVLHLEGASLARLAKQYGTPLYVYSLKAILENFGRIKSAFAAIDPLIAYSAKANTNGAILRALARQGAGLDVVSGGELIRGLKAGIPAARIIFAGVGKTEQEISLAIENGIRAFNIESLPEAEQIAKVARRLKKTARANLRINPDVDAHTHAYISTGKKENKFGINFDQALEIFAAAANLKGLQLDGIHVHIGSEILETVPHLKALKRVKSLIDTLRQRGHAISMVNLGGGFGIGYGDREEPMDVPGLAKKLIPVLASMDCEVAFEPGRSIVGNAGLLLTQVLYVKDGSLKKFVIVDAGMNDLIRPSLYDAYHRIVRVREDRGEKAEKVDVVGPICESGDFFAKDRKLSPMVQGDLLAIYDAGAYGFAMSSRYNSRPTVAEVLVHKGKAHLVRERETVDDLMAKERIPEFLK